MTRTIDGMVVVITGASSGIGLTLAERLSALGARLALASRRIDRLLSLNDKIGGHHLCVETDVSEPEQCERLVESVRSRFGRIDTLVCNAGYGLIRPLAETREEELLRLFRTNVLGTTACIRSALPHMLRQTARDGHRGQVVVVSSAACRRGLPDMGAYTATKAAQASIADSLRVELRGSGVAVTSVHPVTTSTEFFKAAMRLSGVRPPRRCLLEAFQSRRHVADAIAKAIELPRAELWPHPPSRVLLTLGAFLPGITDWVLSKRRRRFARRDEGGMDAPDVVRSSGDPAISTRPNPRTTRMTAFPTPGASAKASSSDC